MRSVLGGALLLVAAAGCGGAVDPGDAGGQSASGGATPAKPTPGNGEQPVEDEQPPSVAIPDEQDPVVDPGFVPPVQRTFPMTPPDRPLPSALTGDTLTDYGSVVFNGELDGTLCGSAIVGDLDRDGFDDILLSDFGGSGPPESIAVGVRGASYLFYGRPTFPAELSVLDADLVLRGSDESLTGLGDVNGDGFADAGFVSFCACDELGTGYCACPEASGLHILFGSATRYSGTARADQVGGFLPSGGAELMTVGAMGDVNDDGFDDYSIGDFSSIDILLGQPDLASGSYNIDMRYAKIIAKEGGAWGPGDVDGDGYADILVGGASTSLFYGGARSYSDFLTRESADATFLSPSKWFLGRRVGDLDADGFADIVLPGDTLPFFYGSQARFSGPIVAGWHDFSLQLPSHNIEGFGVGDVNADGNPDVVIGDPKDQTNGAQSGATYLVPGAAARLSQDLVVGYDHAIIYGDVTTETGATSCLGYCISSGGDVNGDGFEDILVGKPDNISSPDDPGGRVVLILGGQFGN